MDLSGKWHSSYQYSGGSRDLSSEHIVNFVQTGNGLNGKSDPQDDESRLIVELIIDDKIATGIWEEHTSPTGHYKAAVFHGAIQLVVSEDGSNMTGQWVGFNSNRTKVNSGKWSFSRV